MLQCHNLPVIILQVLEMIAPPYSREFIEIFLPIVKNKSITGTLKTPDGKDDVSKFIGNISIAVFCVQFRF